MDPLIRHIPLTQGKVAVISTHRYEEYSQYNWAAVFPTKSNTFYAARFVWNEGKKLTFYMHGDIIRPRPGFMADHINGDGLDNRDENLREINRDGNQQNTRPLWRNNTSGAKGVQLTREGNWQASITVHAIKVALGTYKQFDDAARVRREAEEKYYGEYRRK